MIYFIRDEHAIKIGFTKAGNFQTANWARRVHNRFGGILVGTPRSLQLLGVIQGSRSRETVLHQIFKAERIRGEWFYATPRLMTFIKNYAVTVPEKPIPKTGPRRIDLTLTVTEQDWASKRDRQIAKEVGLHEGTVSKHRPMNVPGPPGSRRALNAIIERITEQDWITKTDQAIAKQFGIDNKSVRLRRPNSILSPTKVRTSRVLLITEKDWLENNNKQIAKLFNIGYYLAKKHRPAHIPSPWKEDPIRSEKITNALKLRWATTPIERRSAISRKGQMKMTPQQKSEKAYKAWETRRRKSTSRLHEDDQLSDQKTRP